MIIIILFIIGENNEVKGKSKRIYSENSDGNNLFNYKKNNKFQSYNLYLLLKKFVIVFIVLNRK